MCAKTSAASRQRASATARRPVHRQGGAARLTPTPAPADASAMTRSLVGAFAILILGALLMLFVLSTNGPTLSLPLILGGLLIADGILRLLIIEDTPQ